MKLKILTWNISYGYGLGSEGTTGYTQRPVAHFESALESMSEFLRQQKIDIALLQEVDFNSSRSHHLNQLDTLARQSGLLYRDELISWNSPYVPYPGLSPKNHFKKVVSGGGILSRFPIERVLHELLPKPKENSNLYNFFYLNRYLQIVKIKNLTLMNLHLEAFSKENRELHLVKAQGRLADYQIDIAGGDFNGPVNLLSQFKEGWAEHPAPNPTFPSDHPTETLDAFILKKNLREVTPSALNSNVNSNMSSPKINSAKIRVLETGLISDHYSLLLELEVGDE